MVEILNHTWQMDYRLVSMISRCKNKYSLCPLLFVIVGLEMEYKKERFSEICGLKQARHLHGYKSSHNE